MERLVVHPAYWARGHATNLVKWGMELARTDKVTQGVFATKMGGDFFCKLLWKNLTEVRIDGDEIVPQGVSFTVLEYDPTTKGYVHDEI